MVGSGPRGTTENATTVIVEFKIAADASVIVKN